MRLTESLAVLYSENAACGAIRARVSAKRKLLPLQLMPTMVAPAAIVTSRKIMKRRSPDVRSLALPSPPLDYSKGGRKDVDAGEWTIP